MISENILSVMVGIGLSAACGFRIFVPMLVMSIASISGHLTLSSGFAWIGTYPALVAFAVATAIEIAGYYLPYVDHFLDLIASPTAVVAGILAAASTITGMSPFLRWALAIIAGGGVAATVQALTILTRVSSTVATAGLGNPVVSTMEAGGSLLFSVLAVAVPIVAVGAIPLCLVLIAGPGRARLRRLRARKPDREKTQPGG